METFVSIISFFFAILVLVAIVGTYEEVKKLRKENEEKQEILRDIAEKMDKVIADKAR